MTPTFLDFNATTPLDSRVREAMLPWLGVPANAASVHRFGRDAHVAVAKARAQVAVLVGADPAAVIFTSGGTEANNLALRGIADARPGAIVISAIEHAAVREPARQLGRAVELPVSRNGVVDLAALDGALAERPALVSVMWANNETGVLQPVADIAARCRAADVPFHCDAAQAVGKVPVDLRTVGAQLLSVSAHKLYGPQGVGALIVDPALSLASQNTGGGQQGGRRGGTEPVALIVGFGAAAEIAARELSTRARHSRGLRDRLEAGLAEAARVQVVAPYAERLPNTVQFTVSGIDGETLLLELDRAGFAVSSGSACASGRREPSHVLAAMGALGAGDHGVVRVSVGETTSTGEVDAFLGALQGVLSADAGAVGGW
ncbi:MAG: cysteine desulfurase family protein [Gammaproteobacteria bacterium]